MHGVRRVADQRQPMPGIGIGELQGERIGKARPLECQVAEIVAEPAFQLALKSGLILLENGARQMRLLGPDHRGTPTRQGQNGERTGRQEMFLGRVIVGQAVGDRADDRGLIVIPARHTDARALAHRRAAAVGGYGHLGADGPAVGKMGRDAAGLASQVGQADRGQKGDIRLFSERG